MKVGFIVIFSWCSLLKSMEMFDGHDKLRSWFIFFFFFVTNLKIWKSNYKLFTNLIFLRIGLVLPISVDKDYA